MIKQQLVRSYLKDDIKKEIHSLHVRDPHCHKSDSQLTGTDILSNIDV